MWKHEAVIIAGQPSVQVVTAGTDWPAIIAAIVTGLAAVIGIAGTAWQAGRARQAASADLKTSMQATTENLGASIEAEDRRALRSQKILVYSEFQSALDSLASGGLAVDPRAAIAAMNRAAAAVILIASDDIGRLVTELTHGNFDDARDSKRQELYRLMRADLGTDH